MITFFRRFFGCKNIVKGLEVAKTQGLTNKHEKYPVLLPDKRNQKQS
jgi:hypothetical protein